MTKRVERQNHIFRPALGGLASDEARYPGFIADPQLQHHEVACGASRLLKLHPGDLMTLTNRDGGAALLLLALDENGRPCPDALGLPSKPLETIARADVTAWAHSQGGDGTVPAPVVLFDPSCAAGEMLTLRADRPLDVWLMSLRPDDAEIADGGAGGHFLADVKSATVQSSFRLPDPLAPLRDEFRVDAATAHAYEVRKGDLIQILDVQGRQCSDFMAMRSSALDRGLERHIDGTVTRSMVGGAYPGPGLFDKFYDQDMRPLLAVRQDTVGRHDTFALACTARGYEERGFPGHINCSDNISHAYAPFSIQQRRAWPAINFFYNSAILPTDNRIRSDEAWSRPGDYVLMEALTDLVCVTTACPDDVDPINGWNPTDIHVRIYKGETGKLVPRAIAHRPEPEAEPVMTQNSAFHPATAKLTNQYAPARDLWLPTSYDGVGTLGEYWACREAVTIQDMSSLRKFDILGPDAERLLQLALTKDISRLAVHRGLYGLLCDETGAVVDDGTLFRLAPECFRWACGSEESGEHLRALAAEQSLKVWIKSLSSAMPNLALQGPNSRDLLRDVIFTQPNVPALDAVKWFGCTVARLHNREGPAFLLTRTGYTGELGYEIFCAATDAPQIWDALMVAGAAHGLKPMGGHALEMIRIEAGLMAAGAEFVPEVDAFEAGLGFAIDFRKPAFVGREALQRDADHPKRKLVGLAFDSREVPHHGDGLFLGRRQIGTITSATHSPKLDQVIAMARVAIEHAQLGTQLEVGRLDGHMKRLSCTVTGFPFIDPTRARARA